MWLWLLLATSSALQFSSTWQTTVPNEVISLPLPSSGSWTVDWGNGTLVNYTSTPANTYAVPGNYTINIFGTVKGFSFFGTSGQSKIMSVQSWGGFVVDAGSYGAFKNCVNLQVSASDQPVIEPGAILGSFFESCTVLNTALSWNVSNVIKMGGMFFGASNFNQPLVWDTSKVTDLSYMFYGASKFNQPLAFDTSQVTDMSNMFRGASNFNQVLAWNTPKVTRMEAMFYNAANFNQPLAFNTSQVRDMSFMLFGASKFNQPLAFDTSKVTDMSNMFAGASSFDQDLSAWRVNVTGACVNFCTCCRVPSFLLCLPCAGGKNATAYGDGTNACCTKAPSTLLPTIAPSASPTSGLDAWKIAAIVVPLFFSLL